MAVTLLESLHEKRLAVATEILGVPEGMKAYAIIYPIRESQDSNSWSNLQPTISYEIRLIMHKDIYTYEEWVLDWDYVIDDKSTRIKRIFVPRTADNSELEIVLQSLNIALDNCQHENYFGGVLMDILTDLALEPIDSHLWIDDWSNVYLR
jgi:hypothetical protein